MSKPEHFLIIARPMRPVPMMAMVLPVTSSPRNGRNGCHDGHFCSRTRRSLCHILRASIPIMKKANSAVASVSTSAVLVNGILYLFASARLMLSKPTAICATTLSEPFPASKTSASIGSRSVVIKRVDAALHFLDDQFLRRRLGSLKDLELVAALAQTVLGRIADAGGGKDAEVFLVGHDRHNYDRLSVRSDCSRFGIAYRFFFAQAPTRSSAFSMFSIELATLKRK